jgi:cytochrome b involved in lipid metabolism
MQFTIIDNKIYDVTDFVHEHPGGAQVLLTQVGKDATGTCYFLSGHERHTQLEIIFFGPICWGG